LPSKAIKVPRIQQFKRQQYNDYISKNIIPYQGRLKNWSISYRRFEFLNDLIFNFINFKTTLEGLIEALNMYRIFQDGNYDQLVFKLSNLSITEDELSELINILEPYSRRDSKIIKFLKNINKFIINYKYLLNTFIDTSIYDESLSIDEIKLCYKHSLIRTIEQISTNFKEYEGLYWPINFSELIANMKQSRIDEVNSKIYRLILKIKKLPINVQIFLKKLISEIYNLDYFCHNSFFIDIFIIIKLIELINENISRYIVLMTGYKHTEIINLLLNYLIENQCDEFPFMIECVTLIEDVRSRLVKTQYIPILRDDPQSKTPYMRFFEQLNPMDTI
jgi:hypothetical protein